MVTSDDEHRRVDIAKLGFNAVLQRHPDCPDDPWHSGRGTPALA